MDRLPLLLFVILAGVAHAQIACEVDTSGADSLIETDTQVLHITNDAFNVTSKISDVTLQQLYQIQIQTSNFRVLAFDGHSNIVGDVLDYLDLLAAKAFLEKAGNASACKGILACDGFEVSAVKVMQQFPQNASFYVFNYTFLVISPASISKQSSWVLWTVDVPVGAQVVDQSEPQLVNWQPSAALIAKAFPPVVATSTSSETGLILGLSLGIGIFVCVATICICIVAARDKNRRQSNEEMQRLVGAPPQAEHPELPAGAWEGWKSGSVRPGAIERKRVQRYTLPVVKEDQQVAETLAKLRSQQQLAID